MSLISTYEKFTHINEEFIAFIDKLVRENFESFTEEEIKSIEQSSKNYVEISKKYL